MENKSSFVLYSDLLFTVEKLPDEQAGLLFKHILNYVSDNDPVTDDLLVEISFEPIKQQLKRDLDRWKESRERRAEAGRKGGLARASNAKQRQANQAVNVNGNVNVNANVSVINKQRGLSDSLAELFEEFKEHRRQLKSPMTEIAVTRMINKLKKQDEKTAEAMLIQSMENGWSGIFEVKPNNNTKDGKTRAEQAIENVTSGGNQDLNQIEGLGSF